MKYFLFVMLCFTFWQSGLRSRSSTSFVWALISRTGFIAGNCQRRMQPSAPPVAISFPLQLTRTTFWKGSSLLMSVMSESIGWANMRSCFWLRIPFLKESLLGGEGASPPTEEPVGLLFLNDWSGLSEVMKNSIDTMKSFRALKGTTIIILVTVAETPRQLKPLWYKVQLWVPILACDKVHLFRLGVIVCCEVHHRLAACIVLPDLCRHTLCRFTAKRNLVDSLQQTKT